MHDAKYKSQLWVDNGWRCYNYKTSIILKGRKQIFIAIWAGVSSNDALSSVPLALNACYAQATYRHQTIYWIKYKTNTCLSCMVTMFIINRNSTNMSTSQARLSIACVAGSMRKWEPATISRKFYHRPLIIMIIYFQSNNLGRI